MTDHEHDAPVAHEHHAQTHHAKPAPKPAKKRSARKASTPRRRAADHTIAAPPHEMAVSDGAPAADPVTDSAPAAAVTTAGTSSETWMKPNTTTDPIQQRIVPVVVPAAVPAIEQPGFYERERELIVETAEAYAAAHTNTVLKMLAVSLAANLLLALAIAIIVLAAHRNVRAAVPAAPRTSSATVTHPLTLAPVAALPPRVESIMATAHPGHQSTVNSTRVAGQGPDTAISALPPRVALPAPLISVRAPVVGVSESALSVARARPLAKPNVMDDDGLFVRPDSQPPPRVVKPVKPHPPLAYIAQGGRRASDPRRTQALLYSLERASSPAVVFRPAYCQATSADIYSTALRVCLNAAPPRRQSVIPAPQYIALAETTP